MIGEGRCEARERGEVEVEVEVEVEKEVEVSREGFKALVKRKKRAMRGHRAKSRVPAYSDTP